MTRTRRAVWVALALIALSSLLGQLWIVKYPGVAMMEALLTEQTPRFAGNTVLVTIDADEYRQMFGGISPLNVDRLGASIKGILALQPKLLAVNFDTSDPSFRRLPDIFKDVQGNARIVWARSATPAGDKSKASGFLGQDSGDRDFSGVSGFERDADWRVRTVKACVTVDGERQPTFHRAIVLALSGTAIPTAKCGLEDLAMPLLQFTTVTLTQVQQAVPGQPNLLAGKTVILGGIYSINDFQPGPTGLVSGVHLVASAVEAQRSARASSWRRPVHWALSVLIDGFLGWMVVGVYSQRWTPLAKLSAALSLSVLALFLPGLVLFLGGTWSHAPFLVVAGMLIHRLYEDSKLAASLDANLEVVNAV